jgi:hypothetical protein
VIEGGEGREREREKEREIDREVFWHISGFAAGCHELNDRESCR